MRLVTTVDVDKQVVVNLRKMSRNIVDKAPKSALKTKCLAALDASETEEEQRGMLLVLVNGCDVLHGCWVVVQSTTLNIYEGISRWQHPGNHPEHHQACIIDLSLLQNCSFDLEVNL